MTKWQKIWSIISALLMILFAYLLYKLEPLDLSQLGYPGAEQLTPGSVSYFLILIALLVVMLFYGIRQVFFFFTMAIYATGGRFILYRGILFIDLALFTISLNHVPVRFIMIYLIGMLVFAGGIKIFQALDTMKLKGFWLPKLLQGIIIIGLALYAMTHLEKPLVVSYIYSNVLVYEAFMRIASAFTPTNIITIQ